jgi:uncharacterized Zn-binding protein involved in type VI secretion
MASRSVCRLGDKCSGHGCFPPRPNDQASSNVFVNGIGTHRQTDHWPIHCCGDTCHTSNLAKGSSTVYVNGLQLGRIGDPVACGSAVAQGSPNVFAGG